MPECNICKYNIFQSNKHNFNDLQLSYAKKRKLKKYLSPIKNEILDEYINLTSKMNFNERKKDTIPVQLGMFVSPKYVTYNICNFIIRN